jgi:hypothetical protein
MYAVMPEYSTALFSARARAHAHKVYQQWGCREILDAIIAHYGTHVLSGPFKGVELIPSIFVEHTAPYLLGTYERELSDAWTTLISGSYKQILDIGAKFGFYAVGLAIRYPGVPVVAFDTDPWARKVTFEMAMANHVLEHVVVDSYCNKDWLKERLVHDALIVSDCEGYEATLFAVPHHPNLESATLLIETHDHEVAGVTALLEKQLSQSHRITKIASRSEGVIAPVDLSFLNSDQQRLAMSDMRPGQFWLVAYPRQGINANLGITP